MAIRGIRFRKRAFGLRVDVGELMRRDGMAGMQICVWVMCSYPVRAAPCLSRKAFCLFAFYSFFCRGIQWGFFVAYVSPNNSTRSKTAGKQQEWGQKVVDPSGERGSAEEWPLILGAAAKKVGVYRTPAPKPDLQDPEVYLDLFAKTLDLATSPQIGRHALSVASGADGGSMPRPGDCVGMDLCPGSAWCP